MAKRGKHKHKGRPPFAAAPAAPPSPAAVDDASAAADVDADVELDAQADVQADVQASGAEALEASGMTATEAGETASIAPARVPVRPARLLRSPFLALADYEQRSLAHVAGLPEQLDAPGLWRGVAYRVGRHRLTSGFDEVVEILPLPALTHVPGALPWLLGIANIRGSLLPVVDLKQFLEGERTVLHERQRVLVVRQPGGDVAVTIDELYGQRSFVEAQAIDASALMDGRYAHFVDRAYRMNDQDWGVFSLERLSRTPEFRQAAA
ncbi:chemotaxis signal transduction protein [Thermomonas haemolytica]|uniref:Chemotaxis signal transduction protein n=1 Tax=Thermomonas haemolytica TaxID=141949 RepID=A0A4R3N8F5_9GAMM|nr:chemotaxis signal transduction protein [Thermomonas haemolytica]